MDKKDKKQETQRIKAEALTKRTSVKKNNSDKTQVIGNIQENKKKDKKKKIKFKDKHPRAATIIKITIIVLIVLFIILCGVLAGTLFNSNILKISEKDLVINFENSIVYDINGNEIATLSSGTKRKCISLSEMSEYLPKAYVAIEDERFYNHSGVDFKRTAAATLTYIFNRGKSSFGGSTITQQVVKNITQDKEDNALRKIKEMSKALQVEKYLSKTQILELYLNLIFVGGDDINGVELGSIYYFDKSAKDLSIAECAFLAGINHSPNLYKPFEEDPEGKKYEAISKRTKTVLGKMKELNYITEEQYNEAKAEVENRLKFSNGDGSKVTTELSYQTEAAIEQIINQMVEEKDMTKDMAEIKLYSGGYKIYTTQDSNIQQILESELIKDKYAIKSPDKKQVSMACMVLIDHKTGNVIASSGVKGAGEERTTKTRLGYMNYPKDLLKSTGSSMKPLSVIAPGLETGSINAATVYYDGATVFGGGYPPKNYYQGYKGLMNIRNAIAISANIPNVKALANTGMEACYEFLSSVGIKTKGNEGLPLALGGFDGTSTFNMAAAYAAIANDGVYIEPTFYTKVEDKNGEVYIECKPIEDRSTRVMSEDNAYIEKSILTSVTAPGGTATYCTIPGIDVAAKTGTTNDDLDRWLCGFTPYYTAACWFGFEKNATVVYRGSPSNPAGGIWSSVIKQAHQGLSGKKFEPTSNITSVSVCTESGKLPKEGCPVYTEIFVKGTEPTDSCDVHQTAIICKDTECIANEFCRNTEIRTFYSLPEKEATNNLWSTQYGEQFVSLPELCTHKASDFTYSD
ncbi:MAG: transglycosylase domain-containing protein [Candidatus Scatovivens sp.]